ncbi:Pancreatic progenitor cell differentiation and proliferation factor B [Larimichthys crocea]|uniref:Pancreatic progenitor cell differentiation and proliferation factor B n=1 Tax=Larimichthys crocea TaxID=215358 RepID=A0A6G0IMJ7_LARCR|nr:Pancreatic progenitor cell differentiation and proliferation factor B [Larimichthys crocea]
MLSPHIADPALTFDPPPPHRLATTHSVPSKSGSVKGFHQAECTATNGSRMAAIPAGGSLVATTDYYRRRIGSTSSSSSCGSSEYSGEVIPHHPGLPKQDSGHWWSSFFFGKQPGMTPLTEEAQQNPLFNMTKTTRQSVDHECTPTKNMNFMRKRPKRQGQGSRVRDNGQITCVAREMVMQRQ